MRKIPVISIVLVILICVLYGFFLSHKINLVTADLGRHIKNGEMFFSAGQGRASLFTNFYSYTEPNFPAINHHWASGILFFLLWKFLGFGGVQFFFILLSLATFFIFFNIARKSAGTGIATIVSLLIIPLLAERTEIRPEAFSYFFAGLFLWLAWAARENKISIKKLVAAIAVLQIFWVNTHIYFFLGPAILGTFWLESMIVAERKKLRKNFSWALIASFATLFISPFGLKGAFEPLTIFKNYGYMLVENQSIPFLQKIMWEPNFFIFKFAFAALIASFVFLLVKSRHFLWQNISFLFLAIGFSTMAWLQIRNLAIFGLFALPIISGNMEAAFREKIRAAKKEIARGAFVLLFFVLFFTVVGNMPALFPYWKEFGWGLENHNSAAADFFKKENIQGPIFNNYDIGGYLIFHLYPREKVFVDNRPEAYPAHFFQNTYIPAEEKDERWKVLDQKYHFNAIFFSYHDATPWGQKFLASRVNDPVWAPIYVDPYSLLFVKRNENNQMVIKNYELPKNIFKTSR